MHLEFSGITEIVGDSGVGKTNLVLSLIENETTLYISTNIIPRDLNGENIYICKLENILELHQQVTQIQRHRKINQNNTVDSNNTVDNIIAVEDINAVDIDENISVSNDFVLNPIDSAFSNVIIDGLDRFLYTEDKPRSRHKIISQISHGLKRLSDRGIRIFIINHYIEKNREIYNKYLGYNWAYCINNRYLITKDQNGNRKIKNMKKGEEREFRIHGFGRVEMI